MNTLYGQARAKATYEMRLKDGSVWYLDGNGGILWDGSRSMGFEAPHDSWRILGFTTRHNSNQVIPLKHSTGADLGQGWVHDIDHGSHRMWAMPKSRRVKEIHRIR